MPKHILVVWFFFSANGGINRFVNVAKVLESWGHTVGFCSLSDEVTTSNPYLQDRILTYNQAREKKWDSVMIPGAGASEQQMELFKKLQNASFGVRVQHVLNDITLYDDFMRANEMLKPDVVIFNNSHWKTKDFAKFSADAFYYLPGAVNPVTFYPLPFKSLPLEHGVWKIGGYGSKNPLPLFELIAEHLDNSYQLHLYGQIARDFEGIVGSLKRSGQLVTYGPLFENDLAAFYRNCDLLITTEENAGWCNTAAEAFACAIPTIVTEHGTIDFARHMQNCIVVNDCSAKSLAEAVRTFTANPKLMMQCAVSAADTIRRFTWESYCQKLMVMIKKPPFKYYYRVPQIGLNGKWDIDVRINDFKQYLKVAKGKTILDLGSAEGVISHVFAKYGEPAVIHGFEYEKGRVDFAQRLIAQTPKTRIVFRQADISNWERLVTDNKEILLESYDIVLFLGLYHHLPPMIRRTILHNALSLCREYFFFRTPRSYIDGDLTESIIQEHGFKKVHAAESNDNENCGWLGIYQKATLT